MHKHIYLTRMAVLTQKYDDTTFKFSIYFLILVCMLNLGFNTIRHWWTAVWIGEHPRDTCDEIRDKSRYAIQLCATTIIIWYVFWVDCQTSWRSTFLSLKRFLKVKISFRISAQPENTTTKSFVFSLFSNRIH